MEGEWGLHFPAVISSMRRGNRPSKELGKAILGRGNGRCETPGGGDALEQQKESCRWSLVSKGELGVEVPNLGALAGF